MTTKPDDDTPKKPDKPRSKRRLGIGSGKPPPPKEARDDADADKRIREQVSVVMAGGFLLWRETTGALDELLDHITSGGHLNGFCKARGFSFSSMSRWLQAMPERLAMYERAREERTHILVDEIVELSDEIPGIPVEVGKNEDGEPKFEILVTREAIAAQRLRIETRQWYASRLNARYREKTVVDATLTDKRTITDEDLLAQLQALGIAGVSLSPPEPT